jgi:glycerol-3-phosphate dehydrogenase
VEVRYLSRSEWAVSTEDVLWRRSKLGLRFSEDEVVALRNYLRELERSPLATQ